MTHRNDRYAKQNGGNTSWIIEGTEAIPTEQAFWDWLMADAKGWGLYVYEQDWLFTEWYGPCQFMPSQFVSTRERERERESIDWVHRPPIPT